MALFYFGSTPVLLAEGSMDVNFNMIYHKGTNFTKIITASFALAINKYKNLKHEIFKSIAIINWI